MQLADYEVMYILNSALNDEEVAEHMRRFAQTAKDQGAQVGEPKVWGKRRLAYPINQQTDGTYVLMDMSAAPAAVRELDRQLKLAEPVLRHLVVRQTQPRKPKEKEEGQENVQQSGPGGQDVL
jgi:small subunit ribosomal protein S6